MRFLVQFRNKGESHFITDCGFPTGNLDKAKAFMNFVVSNNTLVAEGRVWDSETGKTVWVYKTGREL